MRFRISLLGLPSSVSNRISVGRSNALAVLPPMEDPKYRIVGPKLKIMDKQIRDLDTVLAKLVSLIFQFLGLFPFDPRTRKPSWSG